MSENDVMAQAMRTFDGDEGFKTPDSDPFPVSRQRFAELKANGLVAEADPVEQKAAAKPSNKMAAKTENK